MELPQRHPTDIFLPPGQYQHWQQVLSSNQKLADVRSLVISAFDLRTRMHPFIHYDWFLVPCGPRSVAGALYAANMRKTRLVFQLWNPNIRPSRSLIEDGPPDQLLISSLQIHSASSYRLIEDAWSMGAHRPLIIAGGPKACYEPFDFFGIGPRGGIGADVVVTGEESVLLELMTVLSDFKASRGSMLSAFQLARDAGALHKIPGLVFALDGRQDGQNLFNTGIQRLLRNLDELPLPSDGFRTLEPPHRRQTLAANPMPLNKACRPPMVATILITRGCKFHCPYCPIPAYNQRTLRHKSPQRIIEELIDCRRHMNTRTFFGADDNFFNDRKVAQNILQAIDGATWAGKRLGRQIRLMTESTVIDAYKNRDLLPLARRAGMSNLWMGVEDLAARLVNKGQTPGLTEALFDEMLNNKIAPRVMLMHHDAQPLHDRRNLAGLLDQVRFLFDAGAVGLQCTVASPALGSRWANEVFTAGKLYERIGGRSVVDSDFDGNHVVSSTRSDPWRIQFNLLRAYAAFYNPTNFVRILLARHKPLGEKRIFEQLHGIIALVHTIWRLKGHLWRLWRGPIECMQGWPERFRRTGTPYPGLMNILKENPRDSAPPDHAVPKAKLPSECALPVV
jgi:hypothetical protein